VRDSYDDLDGRPADYSRLIKGLVVHEYRALKIEEFKAENVSGSGGSLGR